MRLNRLHSVGYKLAVLLALLVVRGAWAGDFTSEGGLSAGFLFDEYKLTLEAGERREAAGPFFYCERTDNDETFAFPPFFSNHRDLGIHASEYDIIYPVLTYEHYQDEWRWQFCELLSFAGGRQPDEYHTRRFTLFPLYFQQRSLDTNLNYTAVVPFYGHLQNRLFRDRIYFVMFPAYSQTQKRDIITDNYFYPFVHVRTGNGLHGWQVWPIVGKEHKDITTETNGFGDVSTVPGHDDSFLFWPFWLKQNNGIGTTDPDKFRASIPFFVKERSPLRDQTSVLWPFFSWIDERGRQYHEWEGPWPFVIFARGPGKTTDRVWPIFSQSHDNHQESDSYVWPLYRYKHYHVDPLDEYRHSVLFYLYVNVLDKNTETGKYKQRTGILPLYFWEHDFNGNERLQVLAFIENVLPNSRGIVRNWAPLWTVWQQEKNPQAKTDSESLLWNLYRREAGPSHKKISLLFGLFQYQRDEGSHRTRLFYITISRTHAETK